MPAYPRSPFRIARTQTRYRSPWDLPTGTFYKGRVMVAGDAMHVMGTFMGQGGSTGLEEAVVLARNMSQFGFNRTERGRRLMVHGVEEAFNLFVKQRRMRVVQLSLQIYLTGMLLGASSRLKKVISYYCLFFLATRVVILIMIVVIFDAFKDMDLFITKVYFINN
ncbi:aromatic-ring hydroxylase-like protein [Tanacetum coccineum]